MIFGKVNFEAAGNGTNAVFSQTFLSASTVKKLNKFRAQQPHESIYIDGE